MRTFQFISLAIGLSLAPLAGALTSEQVLKDLPEAEIEKALPGEHPSAYYLYAGRLFKEGKKDDAVFWFYVGQLRYRFHLMAHPNLEPSGDPALFGSLSATLGEQINLHAGGNTKDWIRAIDRALKWDADTTNGFTSKKKFAEVYKQNRAGLKKLREWIESQADYIREERKQAGLDNRG